MYRPVSIRVMIGILGLVAALEIGCRLAGFGDGVLLGATPASGVAFFAALRHRALGALAAGAGFALAALVHGLALPVVATTALAHGFAALLAALSMRALAHRRVTWSRTSDWMIFICGVAVFTVAVGMVYWCAALAGILGPVAGSPAWLAALMAFFQPLGLLTMFAVIASRAEWRAILARPAPALVPLALAVFLLGALAAVLTLRPGEISASGATLVASLPFCLWIAMQPRSLDGAVIAFFAAHAALYMVLRSVGGIGAPEYLTTIFYLNLLIAIARLVHAVNRDRATALETLAAHQAELEYRVAERTARLTMMTERAVAADSAKSRFLATVSHEVRTPLNGVIGMASVVLAGRLDPAVRANVEVIRTSGFHLLDVINRILDFSRLENGGAFEEPADFDLGALIDEVMNEARFLPRGAGVDLLRDLPRNLPLARHGCRQGLRQVLTNLVGNGLKFTESGSVLLRLREGFDDILRIEVEDSGIGVPAEARERIFQPFEQADGTMTRRFGGTGLGLAISAEIVTRMGGRIGVEGPEGKGARFWIELPLPQAVSRRPESLQA